MTGSYHSSVDEKKIKIVQKELLIVKIHLNELLYLNLRFVKVQVLLNFQFLLSSTEGKHGGKKGDARNSEKKT
jgi:hypothetical protein